MKISDLIEYGIPQKIIDNLLAQGFLNLTIIQEQAVRSDLFKGNNLLISAPTNTGKTFIAELAVINTILHKTKTKTFYLLPLKSLADEKFTDLNNKYAEWGLNIAISTGDRAEFDSDLMNYDIIIATYKKLLILILKHPDLIDNPGVVIIDEIQNIGDPFRGVNLEILLSLLLTKGPENLQLLGRARVY
jgi:helicase